MKKIISRRALFNYKLSFIIFNLSFIISSAQDIHFSQFYMTSVSMNPAMSGYNHDVQVLANYKTQWQSVPSPYKTMAASFDMKFKNQKATKGFMAGGINFFDDNSGDARMSTMQANLSLAYHVHVSRYATFGGGLQGGFAQRSVNSSAFQWGNQFDGMDYNASLGTGETNVPMSKAYLDLGGGVLWNYNNTSGDKNVAGANDMKITIGASAFHLTQPNYSFYKGSPEKLNMKIVIHGNALIGIKNTNVDLGPGFFYYRQGPVQEIYAGGMIKYKLGLDSKFTGLHHGAAVSLGGFMRAGDAFIVTTLFEYSQYAIGLSYDVNTSQLRTATNSRGGFEISLRFVNPNPLQHRGKSRI